MDRRTVLCLYVPGFWKQVFKHVSFLSEPSPKIKEQKNWGEGECGKKTEK